MSSKVGTFELSNSRVEGSESVPYWSKTIEEVENTFRRRFEFEKTRNSDEVRRPVRSDFRSELFLVRSRDFRGLFAAFRV